MEYVLRGAVRSPKPRQRAAQHVRNRPALSENGQLLSQEVQLLSERGTAPLLERYRCSRRAVQVLSPSEYLLSPSG